MSKIDEIVNRYSSNELTYIDREGEHKINIDEFVKTGSDTVLQKLNRTEQVLLKVANAAPEKLKWVNDYAMAKVVQNLFDKVDGLHASLIEKDTEIERLNNEATASRVAFETADGISKEDAEKLLEKIEILEADDQIHLSQIDQLIRERDEALEHESIAIKQMETKSDEFAALEERFNKSVEAYKTLKAENTELNNKLMNSSADMDSQYNELATKYNVMKDELESLQSEAAVATDRHNQLVQQYEEEVKLSKNIQEEYDKLNVEYNDRVAEIITLKNQLDTNANDMGNEIDHLNVRIENLMKDNEDLNAKITELQQLRTDLEHECNNYAGEFEKASARCQEIDSRNEELNAEYEKQQDLIKQLEEQYNKTCEQKMNLESSYTGLFNNYNEITTSYNALMVSLDDSTDQLNNMISKLRTSDDNYNKELEKNNELSILNTSLQDTINTQIKDIEDFKVKLEESMKECALLKGKIKHTENYEEMYNRYDTAIKNFIEAVNPNVIREEHKINKSTDNQHRMGDNQVVDFNLGQ